jgi:hypothetical protein
MKMLPDANKILLIYRKANIGLTANMGFGIPSDHGACGTMKRDLGRAAEGN